jgi:CubicO group peptidase (beta-lactamase class C family)
MANLVTPKGLRIATALAMAVTAMATLLFAGCAPPAKIGEPASASPVDARIRRVENGLREFDRDGTVHWDKKYTIAERMEDYGVPGVSIAVIDDFQIDWARGYGVLEAGGDELVTPATLFHAGSVAKPVSAAGALALVEQGLLELDQDVNDRLVSWRVPESEYTTDEKVTLRRLLSHSAGLTDGFTDDMQECCYSLAGDRPPLTVQQMLEADPETGLSTPTRVTMTPGVQYRYSNLGYGVVELLMVDASQKPFAQVMQETVVDPRTRATTEHDERGQPFEGERHHFPILASGGLWTTPSDLARFAIELTLARAGKSSRLFSQEMATQMLAPQIDLEDDPLSETQGLGPRLSGDGPGLLFLHSGGTWGSTCILWAYPETGQGAVVMTNSRAGEGLIRLEILASISAEYGWP